ncbi:MAG: hypothetical protein ABIH67_03615 [Candidatus Uhrbacteria bacterium]
MTTRPCVYVYSKGSDSASRLETKIRSVVICAYFEHVDVDIKFVAWDGRTDTLPVHKQPVLVDATQVRNEDRPDSRMSELLVFADHYGHLIFKDNQLIVNGSLVSERNEIKTLLDEFMRRHQVASSQE